MSQNYASTHAIRTCYSSERVSMSLPLAASPPLTVSYNIVCCEYCFFCVSCKTCICVLDLAARLMSLSGGLQFPWAHSKLVMNLYNGDVLLQPVTLSLLFFFFFSSCPSAVRHWFWFGLKKYKHSVMILKRYMFACKPAKCQFSFSHS